MEVGKVSCIFESSNQLLKDMERLTILTLIRWAKENECAFQECEDCFNIYAPYSKAKKLMAFVKKNGIDSLFRFVEWSKVHAFVHFANY